MGRSELLKLFMIIQNAYQGFETKNEFKIAIWLELLQDTQFELAERNLMQHIKSSQFPPTIADLNKRPEHAAIGRYIPNAEETRQMLQEQERQWQSIKALDDGKERVINLVRN